MIIIRDVYNQDNNKLIILDDLFENYDNNKMIRKDNGKSLDLGTEVEILVGSELRHGVIRWIDSSPGSNTSKIMAAIEFVSYFIRFIIFACFLNPIKTQGIPFNINIKNKYCYLDVHCTSNLRWFQKDDPHLQGTDGAYSEVKHLNRKLNRSMCTDTKSCQQSNVTPVSINCLKLKLFGVFGNNFVIIFI